MRLPGLGPKTARRIWQELGITTLAELKAAARGAAAADAARARREDRGEHPQGARAHEAGDRRRRGALLGPGAAGAARGRRGAARASGRRPGLRGGQRAPAQGDGARPRHHRDRQRPEGADRRTSRSCRGSSRSSAKGATKATVVSHDGLPLRPARRAARELRQPAAALHRLEGPQRRAARGRRSGAASRSPSTASPRSRAARSSRPRARSEVYERLGYAVHPARAARERAASSRRRASGELPRARRAGRPARRPAHAHALVGRRQEHARGDGRGREGARLRVLRDHRPLALPARGPAGAAGEGDRRAARSGSRRSRC